jgi:hypothetical protein
MEDHAHSTPQPREKTRRKRKDPRPLLELLSKARLQGPRDWATNIDDYIYRGKRPDIAEGEDAGEQTE